MKPALLATLVLVSAASAALAQQPAAAGHDTHHADAGAAPAAAADDMSEGEVRKVDKATGKITLRHGPIRNLDMPAMTMVFKASDPALLDKLKPGDKVRFVAGKDGASYTVREIEPVR